jgi:hypothetical protein
MQSVPITTNVVSLNPAQAKCDLGFLREILVNNLQMLALGFRVIVLNATFNNISAISWRPVLLVEEIGVPGENHRPIASH